MRHPAFPGVGKRIRDRLLALGYVREDKEPDVGRFLKEKGYDGRYFYPWLKDRTPSGEFLDRLAVDLQCSRAWILLGEGPEPKPRRKPLPIAGGSANAPDRIPQGSAEDGTLGVNVRNFAVPPIRHWLLAWWWPNRLCAQLA